jgi:alkylhydroperoxidase/carboxymuconolactone decarboxylase family protein YurZ
MTDSTNRAADVLAAVEAKRGYLLTYHRMLAADNPELLAAYDAFYENLTLKPRVLSAVERELVWAALQVAAREAHGHIHMRRAEKLGLRSPDLADALAIAGVVEAWPALRFGPEHWGQWIKAPDTEARYLRMFEAARGAIAPAHAEIIAAVCHAARRTHDGMTLHLARAFPAGATVQRTAEALSYMLLPCGGPALIDAVAAWEHAAKAGLCPQPYP